MESCLSNVDDFIVKIKTLKKLKVEELGKFIVTGEHLLFEIPEVESLKTDFFNGKRWVERFKKFQANRLGIQPTNDTDPALSLVCSSNSISDNNAELKSLLAESYTLNVDLSTYVQEFEQLLRVYCLCRLQYDGEMIGCDTCEEWYHLSCMGIPKSLVSLNL